MPLPDRFPGLSGQDETKDDGLRDTTQCADAAAVPLPARDDAPLQTMGSPEQPVNAWLWRADLEAPIAATATGLGTTVRSKNGSLSAAASYEAGGRQGGLRRLAGLEPGAGRGQGDDPGLAAAGDTGVAAVAVPPKVKRQLAAVFDMNKCLGCQTCTIACKTLWTDQEGRKSTRLNSSHSQISY